MLEHLSSRQKAEILVGVMLAMFLAALDQTIVGTAIPKIVASLNGLSLISWVISAYMLASAVSVPISSKLSDIFGRKTMYMVSIALFLIGSMLCGLAQNMVELIAFRAVQGLGGGFLLASAFTIIGDIFSPRERGRWSGLTGSMFGLASVIGPLVGGYLTDHLSWRWVFYVNVPVGIIAVIALIIGLPNIKRDDHGKIDFLGAFTLAWAVVPLLLALVWGGTQYAWSSPVEWWLFGMSLVGLLAFVLAERRALDPIIPLRYFENRNFTLSNAITFISAAAMFGGIIYIPIFIQSVIGRSATNSGLILIPFTAGVLVSSISTGQFTSRTGRTKLPGLIGLVIMTLAMWLMTHITADTGSGTIIRDMIVLGLGLGVTFPLFPLIVQNEFGPRDIGVVTGALTFFRTIGGAVGTAVLGTLFNNALADKVRAIPHTGIPEPLVKTLSDPNVAQNAAVRDKIIHQVPAFLTAKVEAFVHGTNAALAYAIAHVYIVGVVVGALCFVLMIFIRERPLRESGVTAPVEMG